MFLCWPKREPPEEIEHEKKFKKAIKLLLLGTGESGKTTIIKQTRILHIKEFSDEEKIAQLPFIKQNIHESIYVILDNMHRIQPEERLENEENTASVEFILGLGLTTTEYSQEYFLHVAKVWADHGVQKTFQRSNEYQLIDSAEHFLNKLDDIQKSDYVPTTQDILFCRIRTTTISEIEFNIKIPQMYGGGVANFLMYDVGGQRGERRKWIQVFDGINAILFIISASDFDQTLREDAERNRLVEAFSVFGDVCSSKFLRRAGMIVFLNKQDIFQRKLESGRDLSRYFPEYTNYTSKASSEYEKGKLFLSDKIKEISSRKTIVKKFDPVRRSVIEETLPKRDIYIHYTIATDTKNTKKVFDSVHVMVIKLSLENITSF